ncbi:MAG TPA: extracellular solute-binding protein [Streptosporangiaceae bacterium]|jgi:ABC-type glycerol-3-phosphate transport system substrate-binding protein
MSLPAIPNAITRRDLLRAGAGASILSPLLAACGASGSAPAVRPSGREDFSGVSLTAVFTPGTDPARHGIKAALNAWSARTHGKVNTISLTFADIPVKYAGYLASADDSVDVLYAWQGLVGQFADRLYADLTHRVSAADFSPATIRAMTVNGKLYAVPIHSETAFFIYNKDYFSAAGLDPDHPPATWQELFDAAPRLRKGNRSANATALFGPGENLAWFLAFLNSTPTHLLSPDLRHATFGNHDGLAAFQAIDDGLSSGFFDHAALTTAGTEFDTIKLFSAGTTASMCNFAQLWAVATDPKQSKVSGSVGASIMPGIYPGASGSINGYEGFGVSKFSRQQDAALSLVNELTSARFEKVANLSDKFPPSRLSVLNDPQVRSSYPIATLLEKQGRYNTSRYGAPYYDRMEQLFSKVLASMWKGKITPMQALDQSSTQLQQIIDSFYHS